MIIERERKSKKKTNLQTQIGGASFHNPVVSQVRNDCPCTIWPSEQRYCTVEPTLNESLYERSLPL